MTTPSRHYLKMMLRQLAPVVGDAEWTDFSAYGEEGAKALEAKLSGGRAALAKAFLMARDALESEDPISEIVVLEAQALERQGGLQREKSAQKCARKKGGAARGEQQRLEADEAWRPYVKKFDAFIANGRNETFALKAIKKMILKDEFVVGGTGKPPSERTLRKRLMKK